ncbi:patatin-like phospholipase family protein [Streptomyces rugosispiralis]|uniref:Patatin-like phospholipase family protein n=1 Tax=Streptomyces rugosispiralis TaxID=2967341 RepID=A0ABT1V043_9ACTN|nr:patatin-like phospholipase family protein [Streptomyces rugosispiralis]MCQ8190743.1 patatin-like phospholipase family protein [Streptomyces rugosispiralis]
MPSGGGQGAPDKALVEFEGAAVRVAVDRVGVPAGEARGRDDIDGEQMKVLADRTEAGSRPGARADGYRVALAIEGGGMRGTISAGMALAVHELGLLNAFDAVYGASAGAISAAWPVSSRPEGLVGWADPRFASALIRKRNLLRGRPMVDIETLIEEVYIRQFPLDYASVLTAPLALHPLATDLETGQPVDLHKELTDEVALRLAPRASAALPMPAGGPVTIGGRRFYDAGLAESIPFRQALRDGATHVLVLRSRPPVRDAALRAAPSVGSRLVAAVAFRQYTAEFRAAFLNRPARLADDDRLLAVYDTDTADSPTDPAVLSVRPDATAPSIGRLETDSALREEALEAGRRAIVAQFAPAARS